MKLLWLTDLHLDRVEPGSKQQFYRRLESEPFDAVVITGDISVARLLSQHLCEIAEVCSPRMVHFVLGNHDFYGSSFIEVERIAAECCVRNQNLKHLGSAEEVRLTPTTALIGHRGWADGRAWGSRRTSRQDPDRFSIRDLRGHSAKSAYQKMDELGRESGNYFRRMLPRILTFYRDVIIATHVPPFARAALFNGTNCDRTRLPHYTNISAGGVIQRITEQFPQTRTTVLCGHTHHSATISITPNLDVRVGGARVGLPGVQDCIDL